MTNEEAKNLLQNNLDFENGKKGIYPCPIEQYKLALEVAIEALNTHDDLCSNLAWYINERVRLLKVIKYSKPNEGLQRITQKALERPRGEWLSHYDYCKKHECIPSGLIAFWWCNQCEQGVEIPTNFCPNCGTPMTEKALEILSKREGKRK